MNTKRLLTVLLTVALAVILLAVGVSAADIVDSGTCGDNLTWTLDSEGTLTISGAGMIDDAPWKSASDDVKYVVIEKGISGIGESAFSNCENLTGIVIPEGVTSIGDYAFYSCTSLANITLPEGVTQIGESAFDYCIRLTDITLPESLISIGDFAFNVCSSLTSITLPESLIRIGDYAFTECESLTEITIPKGVTNIGINTFSDCSSLKSIAIPEGVTRISRKAFFRCSSLTDITLPDTVTEMGESVFYGCSSLTSIAVPERVTFVNGSMFDWCSSLIDVKIPEGVTGIGAYAFRGCSSMTSITLPASVAQIDGSAFSECSSLTSITIPEGVTYIRQDVFNGCSSLINITLPKSVTMIGSAAFYGCSSLENIDFPDGLTVIEPLAFYGCSSLKNITLPTALNELCNEVFGECSNLQAITFEGNAPTIGENAFYEVTATAYYPAGDETWTEEFRNGSYGGTLTWVEYQIDNSLKILEQPKAGYAKFGGTAKISVKAQGEGLKYQWYIKNAGQTKYSKSSVTTATYSCKLTEKTKDRKVYCVITDANGESVKTKTTIVREAVSITKQPKDAQAQSGKTVKVSVTASGDGLKYQWYIKNAGAKKYSKSSVTSATYSRKMSDKSQGRQIYCVVTDAYGKTAKTQTVVLRMAATITQQPQNACGNYGDTLRISLGASGDGLSYQWYVKNAGGSKFSKSSITSATYSCKLNEKSAGRQVYCIVTDTYGNTAKSATATIYKELRITSQPSDVTVAEGQTAKVSFQAEGDGLTYTWYFKDVDDNGFKKASTFTGNTYSVKMSAARDGRWVYCVVTDAYGNALSTEMVRLRME